MRLRPGWVLLTAVVCFVLPAPAAAQLLPPGPVIHSPPAGSSHDIAHDPANNIALVVADDSAATPAARQILGRFLDTAGNPLGPLFVIGPAKFGVVCVSYSPHVSNGTGGPGGFLVVWSLVEVETNSTIVFSQLVSYPVGLVGPRQTLTVMPRKPVQLGLAYSPDAQQFLIAWSTCCVVPSAVVMRLDLAGQPVDAATPLGAGTTPINLNPEFEFFSNSVDIVWNPVSGEFGVVYQDALDKRLALVLARVRTDGTIAGRVTYREITFNFHYWSAVDVNPFYGNYVVAWVESVIGVFSGVASIDPSGELMNESATATPGGYTFVDVVFSPVTGTFLLAKAEGARELGEDGRPFGPVQTWSIQLAQGTALPGGAWMIAGFDFVQTIHSATRSGGCVTPDPFVDLGGGTCHNGGWLPPGIPVPAPPPEPPTPSPTPGGCLTPDPFVALGGGTCVNGGWLPPTMPPPSPPPPPAGCTTPDPFVSIPGMAGICVNGGWIPTSVIAVTGTMRFVAADGVWAIDAGGGVRHQLAVPPPIAIRVDGITVSVTAKIRTDLPVLPGYFQVVEVMAVLSSPLNDQ